MAVNIPSIDPLFNTFNYWVDTTNLAANIISLSAVTVSSNSGGSYTTGNAIVQGIFSSNTISISDSLRGGSLSAPSALNIFSDVIHRDQVVSMSSNVAFSGTNTNVRTASLSINGSNLLVTSNVNFRSNTLNVSTTGRVGVNTGIADATLKVFGSANISGLSIFGSNVICFDDVSISGEVITDQFTTNSANTRFLNVLEAITIASSVRARAFGTIRQSLQVGENALVGRELQVSNSISADILYSNNLSISNPIDIPSGGFNVASHEEGIMSTNNGVISYLTGNTNQVLYFGDEWTPAFLPNMSYQNSTSVNITGGNVESISSLAVVGNATLPTIQGNVSNISVLRDISTSSLIISNPLSVTNGGTGNNSMPNNHLLIGNGSSSIQGISPEGHQLYLRSDGTSWGTSNLIDALRPQLSALVTQNYVTTRSGGVKIGGFLMAYLFNTSLNTPSSIGTTFNAAPSNVLGVMSTPSPFNLYILGWPPGSIVGWLLWVRYGTWRIVGRFGTGTVSQAPSFGGALCSLVQRVS